VGDSDGDGGCGCSAARSSANEHNSFANSNETLFCRIFNDHLEFCLGAESLWLLLLPRSLSFSVAVACPTVAAFKPARALKKESFECKNTVN